LKKRLAAILAADVAGYSRLVGVDEGGTIARLTTLRQDVLAPLIGEHGGRIVKLTGDGLLCEFGSAADAVACALAWQAAVADREGRAEDARRIRYRIGVNLGDVIVEGDDILGDGVNVAARLEGIAEPGTVCLSEKVYREVRNKLPVTAVDLGPQRLKNIAEPVHAYRLAEAAGAVVRGGEAASGNEAVLPKERMIAVMPFANLSGDPADNHLCEGLAAEIITALSWMRELGVMARQSSFALRDRNMTVADIGRELGVGYVLEGSVRRGGQQIRVAAQLIDVASGGHLWSERYDRETADLFGLLDEITRRVVTALQSRIGIEESARFHGTVQNPEAWALAVRATAEETTFTREGNLRARQLLEKALGLEPGNWGVKTVYAWAHLAAAHYGYVADPAAARNLARSIATELLEVPEERDQGHSVMSWCCAVERDFANALEHSKAAIRLRPNHASHQHIMAMIQVLVGDGEEALRRFRMAARLNPYYPGWYLWPLCDGYRLIGDRAAYLECARRYVSRTPGFYAALLRLVGALVQNGLLDEARAQAKEVLEIEPEFGLSARLPIILPFREPKHFESYLADLRAAGLPE